MHAYIQIKVHTANQQYKDIELCIVCAWLHQFAIQITIISCVAMQLNDCEWRWLYLVIALDLAPARCSYTFNEFIDLFSNRHFHSSHYYSFDFSIQFAKKKNENRIEERYMLIEFHPMSDDSFLIVFEHFLDIQSASNRYELLRFPFAIGILMEPIYSHNCHFCN